MPFPAASVGLKLDPRPKDIQVRDILAYAAGLGASEPAFLDDRQTGGLKALPFQCVSLEWPVLVSARNSLVAALSPVEATRSVHAIQDSHFHRPIRPGDRLVTDGELISARRSRAGVVAVFRLVTRDIDTGQAVTTSWSTSIYRGVALEGEDATLASAPDLPEAALEPLPADAESVRIFIPPQMPHVYTECAAIWNPIHTEREVAISAGLPDIILHGTATWALAGLTIMRRYADSDSARVKRISGRFAGMVLPGDTITVRHAPLDGSGLTIGFEVLAGDGAAAITQGVLVLKS
jgi:acyl dehydratase